MTYEQASALCQHLLDEGIIPSMYTEISTVHKNEDGHYLVVILHDSKAGRQTSVMCSLDFASSSPPFPTEVLRPYHENEFPELVYRKPEERKSVSGDRLAMNSQAVQWEGRDLLAEVAALKAELRSYRNE